VDFLLVHALSFSVASFASFHLSPSPFGFVPPDTDELIDNFQGITLKNKSGIEFDGDASDFAIKVASKTSTSSSSSTETKSSGDDMFAVEVSSRALSCSILLSLSLSLSLLVRLIFSFSLLLGRPPFSSSLLLFLPPCPSHRKLKMLNLWP
jgi:hypothetical protein